MKNKKESLIKLLIIVIFIFLTYFSCVSIARSRNLKKEADLLTVQNEANNQKVKQLQEENELLVTQNADLKNAINTYSKEIEMYRNHTANNTSRSISREDIREDNYLGEFTSTAYCIENYVHICNNGNPSKTATGDIPIPYKTVAVDPKVIPLGTRLKIMSPNGKVYNVVANDTGGAIKGNKIDIVCPTHNEALQWGRVTVKVWKSE